MTTFTGDLSARLFSARVARVADLDILSCGWHGDTIGPEMGIIINPSRRVSAIVDGPMGTNRQFCLTSKVGAPR